MLITKGIIVLGCTVANTVYNYKVRSVNAGGKGPYSDSSSERDVLSTPDVIATSTYK